MQSVKALTPFEAFDVNGVKACVRCTLPLWGWLYMYIYAYVYIYTHIYRVYIRKTQHHKGSVHRMQIRCALCLWCWCLCVYTLWICVYIYTYAYIYIYIHTIAIDKIEDAKCYGVGSFRCRIYLWCLCVCVNVYTHFIYAQCIYIHSDYIYTAYTEYIYTHWRYICSMYRYWHDWKKPRAKAVAPFDSVVSSLCCKENIYKF